jgi:hypothetical protein
MERRARVTVVGAIVGFVGSVVAILTFVTGYTSLRQLLSALLPAASATMSPTTKPDDSGKLRASPDFTADEAVSPLVAKALARLEIGQNVDYLIQILGPPIVTRGSSKEQPLGATSSDSELLYYRFSFQPSCEIQLLAKPDRSVTAFVVHGCGYNFATDTWKLGKSKFSDLGELAAPTEQLIGGDAKFPAYVEKQYFGRHGHYNTFYFAGAWPGLSLDDSSLRAIDRSSLTMTSVAVAKEPTNSSDAATLKKWDELMAEIVGVHVTRFEGL